MLDTNFSRAKPLAIPVTRNVQLVCIGCGGNGSWLVPHLVRIAWLLQEQGRQVKVSLIDPDRVELKNVARQNFAYDEIGMAKVFALAQRYTGMYPGIEIVSKMAPFHPDMVEYQSSSHHQTILIGCVDNASGRQAIAKALLHPYWSHAIEPRLWWLDLGNDEFSGRILLGNTADPEQLCQAFAHPPHCRWVPAPHLLYPDLFLPKPEEEEGTRLSCVDIQQRNAQSLGINTLLASWAAQTLIELLLSQNLRRFATTVDALTGIVRSRYTTPEHIAEAVDDAELFTRFRKS